MYNELVLVKLPVVVLEFMREPGVDYFDPCVPTPRATSIRSLVDLTAERKKKLSHFDI